MQRYIKKTEYANIHAIIPPFYVPLHDFLMLNKYLNKNEKDFIIRSYVD